ncbi:MAG: suppressor of fused domain protein [Mycobacterium sp.]
MILDDVRAHLGAYFSGAGVLGEPGEASITFLGADRIDVLRFGPDADRVNHYVSLGCSKQAMADPTDLLADTEVGPRAEVVVSLRSPTPPGLAKSVAVLAAAPAVEGLILELDALVDLSAPLFENAPFTAFLLGHSAISDLELPEPKAPVRFFTATPITPTEAAWVRLKGAEAMREAWLADGVDVLDAGRRASSPGKS